MPSTCRFSHLHYDFKKAFKFLWPSYFCISEIKLNKNLYAGRPLRPTKTHFFAFGWSYSNI